MSETMQPVGAYHAPVTERAGASLFPWFLCRLASLPIDSVESLCSRNLEERLTQLRQLDTQLASTRQQVSDSLHHAIGEIVDLKGKRHLLGLRRDLFNLRLPRQADVDAAYNALPVGVREFFRPFVDALIHRAGLLEELRTHYAQEVLLARRKLKQRLSDERFQRGLLLSSRSLFEAQSRYLDSGESGLRSKDVKTEAGLLRYFCRTAMKATPFSTFCLVVPGRLERMDHNGPKPSLDFTGDTGKWRSVVRLNKKTCGLIIQHALGRPAVRRHLRVELNPTLTVEGNQIAFLVASHGQETYRRLDRVDGVGAIIEVLGASGSLGLDELVDRILSHPAISATPDDVKKYVDRLLDVGFIRFDVGIKDQDADWDIPLRALLAPIADDSAQAFEKLLGTLRKNVDRYSCAGLPERAEVLAATQQVVAETFEQVGARGPILEVRLLPFLEDTASSLRASLPVTKAVEHVFGTLVQFTQLTRPIANYRQEQATMRHFFDAHYGTGVARVALLRFCEDFHRLHLNDHREKIARARGGNWAALQGYDVDNPFTLEFIETVRDAKRQIVNLVSQRWSASPNAEELDISPWELERATAAVPKPPLHGGSVSLWVNYLPGASRGDDPRVLLDRPGYAPGYGKQFSRFLHLLPQQICDDLRSRNRRFGPDMLAEIGGDANHNANLHPPLLPYEIVYPTMPPGKLDYQIPAVRMVVERDDQDAHALVLRDGASGRRVLPIDLGFLFKEDRPPLFQLLLRFSPLCDYVMILPEAPHVMPTRLRGTRESPRERPERGSRGAADSVSAGVVYRPRITFGGCLVLARRRWTVPPHLLPQQRPGEPDCEFFVHADRWRREHGMPRELFVRAQAVGYSSEKPKAESPDDRVAGVDHLPLRHQTRALLNLEKPQYVDFASPLLVGLLGRLAARADTLTATLEERYPPADALPRVRTEPFAAEQVMQIDFFDDRLV